MAKRLDWNDFTVWGRHPKRDDGRWFRLAIGFMSAKELKAYVAGNWQIAFSHRDCPSPCEPLPVQ